MAMRQVVLPPGSGSISAWRTAPGCVMTDALTAAFRR